MTNFLATDDHVGTAARSPMHNSSEARRADRKRTRLGSPSIRNRSASSGDAVPEGIGWRVASMRQMSAAVLAQLPSCHRSLGQHRGRSFASSGVWGIARCRCRGRRVVFAVGDAHARVHLELSTQHLAHLRTPSGTPAATAKTMGMNS